MITKFDSLYAGHVDMTDIGYGGTAVNDRKFGNDHLMTVYSKAEAIAKTLDTNGFDTMWMAEHHFQPEGRLNLGKRSCRQPSPNVVGPWLPGQGRGWPRSR